MPADVLPTNLVDYVLADPDLPRELDEFLDDTMLSASLANAIADRKLGPPSDPLAPSAAHEALSAAITAEVEAEMRTAVIDSMRRVASHHGMPDLAETPT
jgi:hypothetical protein